MSKYTPRQALLQKVQYKAGQELIKRHYDEYREARQQVMHVGSDEYTLVRSRAITVLKRKYKNEWRELVNMYAEQLGYSTAEMRHARAIKRAEARRDLSIQRAQARLNRLTNLQDSD